MNYLRNKIYAVFFIYAFLCLYPIPVLAEQPVVTFYLSFEDDSFFVDEFVAQSGKLTIDERMIDFPVGRFGRGIRMNFVPPPLDPMAMTLASTHLDLISAVVFNIGRRDFLGYKEPFFWGAGKLNTGMGAVSFWMKGVPPLPAVLFELTSAAFGRLERDLIGIELDGNGYLTAYLRDARYVYHRLHSDVVPDPGSWNHITLNWDRVNGIELRLNGDIAASSMGNDAWFESQPPGLFHFPAPTVVYDEINTFARPLTGSEIKMLMTQNIRPESASVKYRRSPAESARLRAAAGFDSNSDIPAAQPGKNIVFREVYPEFAGDGHVPGWYVIDGRNEMAWPHEYAFFTIIIGDADFHAEKVDVRMPPDGNVNYVTLTGNLTNVRLLAGDSDMKAVDEVLKTPGGEGLMHFSSFPARRGATFRIPFTESYGTPPGFEGDLNLPVSGDKRIHGIELYDVGSGGKTGRGKPLAIRPMPEPLDERYDFAFHALMPYAERNLVSAAAFNSISKPETFDTGGFRSLSIFSEPFMETTAVGSITLSLPLKTVAPDETMLVRVHDPAVPSRIWNRFAVGLDGFDKTSGILDLTIDFQDIVLTGGDRLWIDIGTAGSCRVTIGGKNDPATLYVEEVPVYIALDEWCEKELIASRAQYSKMYEFMPWHFSGRRVDVEKPYMFGGPFDMLYPAQAVKRVAPDNFLANYLEKFCLGEYSQWGRPSKNTAVPEIKIDNPHKAPQWALFMRAFNTFRKRIVDWMAANLNPGGQLGGGWNDDSLLISYHFPDMGMDGDDNARAIIDSVHAGFDRTGLFKDGYCRVSPIDRHHVGDFICFRYYAVLNNLGRSFQLEREMEAAWHFGHPERTPINYGEGEAFQNAVNILKWYWGELPRPDAYQSSGLETATGQLRYFASMHNDFTFHRYTDAYVHRDDNTPWGSHQLHEMILGGKSPNRWDAHVNYAVMWPSGGGPDVARVILKADNTMLEAACYSFDERKRDLVMRLCRIDDGLYKIALHADPEGNAGSGPVIWQSERALRRFDTVTLPIPPRTPVIITVDQIESHPRPEKLPDLAIDPGDVKRSGRSLTVTVHNLGNEKAENVPVRLLNGDAIIAEHVIECIDAPTDFVAKRTDVTFASVPESRNLRMLADPDDTIREILEENNVVKVMKWRKTP